MKLTTLILMLLLSLQAYPALKWHNDRACYYSEPQTPDINQVEYDRLCWECQKIRNNIISLMGNGGRSFSIERDLSIFLKRIGSPTALRLLQDLKQVHFAI